MRLQAQLLQALALFKAGHATLDQKQAGALGTRSRVGLGHQNHQVGMPAVGDEGLAAVDQIGAVCLQQRRGFHALQVRTCSWFAHGDRAHHLTAGQLGQVLLLLRFGAVMQDVRGDDLAVQAIANAAETCACQFFHLHHRIQLVGIRAAIGLGQGHAQKAVFTGLVPHGAVHVALLFPGFVVGGDFLVHEAAKAVAKGFVVGVEKGAFDHGVTFRTWGWIFIQSVCLVKVYTECKNPQHRANPR